MNKNEYSYIFTIRSSLKSGPRLLSWYEVVKDDAALKATIYAMEMSAKVNMGSPILKAVNDEPLDPDEIDLALKNMTYIQLQEFIKKYSI